MRRILMLLLAWAVLGGTAWAQTLPPLTLAELEAMALRLNPTLAQAEAQVEAARGRALQAGLWPNPTMGYTAEEVSRSPTIRGGEHGIFIEQVIPLGGKLRLRREMFEREADEAIALGEGQRLRVLNAVRALFYEALVAQRRVEIREHLAAVTAEAVGVSRQLLNVGAADRPDLLEVSVEAQQASVRLLEARNRHRQVWRRLAQAVGDPALEPRPLAGELDPAIPDLDDESVLASLLADSPELGAARAAVARAEATLARARKEPVPDLVLRGGPRYNRELLDPGPRPVGWELTADVGLTVPLFDRNQGGIRAAEAELTRAHAGVRRVELALRARFADVFERYATALSATRAYRDDIVPLAEEAHELFLARYQEMAAAYPQVLIAERTRLQVTEQYLDALADGLQAAVLLQGFLLGGGLDAPARPGEPSAVER